MANDDLQRSIFMLQRDIVLKKQQLESNIDDQAETSRQHLIALRQKQSERRDQVRYAELCDTCDRLMYKMQVLADEIRELRVTIRNLEGFYDVLTTSH